MRNLLLLIFLSSLFAFQATAQGNVKKRDIRQATEEVVSLYKLDESQAERMEDIQKQRLLNLASIEALKQNDYERYLQKKRAIRLYVENATRQLLREDQLGAFEKMQARRQDEKETLLRELKVKNANLQERHSALLRLEESWN